MKRIVVAITGASGAIYAKLLLEKLQTANGSPKIAVVMTTNAKEVWRTEVGDESYQTFARLEYDINDFSAPFASGSGRFDTMIIVPCSMGTLGRIAGGTSNDLVTRAADVILKE